MLILIAGLILFLGIHALPILGGPKAAMTAKLGENGYKGVFSLLSLIGFVLIIYGYGQAPKVDLWAPPAWTRHLSMTLMLPVFALLTAAYVPSKTKVFFKHPMLVAIKFWALAHLVANGDLASILLFGLFLVFAVVDRISVKRRGGADPVAPSGWTGDIVVWGAGAAGYAAFLLWLHPLLIGVPVM